MTCLGTVVLKPIQYLSFIIDVPYVGPNVQQWELRE